LLLACSALVLLSGCSHIPGSSHIPGMGKAVASPSATASKATGPKLAKANGSLDAQVAMPSDFPTDMPVYPGARLTAGASFISAGELTWGVEWESADAAGKVVAYYLNQFNKGGDWMFSTTNSGNGFLDGTITRKTDPLVKGTLAVTDDQTVTMISLSLVSSA
jgi:hypothetical protein